MKRDVGRQKQTQDLKVCKTWYNYTRHGRIQKIPSLSKSIFIRVSSIRYKIRFGYSSMKNTKIIRNVLNRS